MRKVLVSAILLFSACAHQVGGLLGSHEQKIWVVRTNYQGVQEIYRCTDDGTKPPVCQHAPLVD